MLLGMMGDSSQLYVKSLVDFPFALMLGAIYGYSVMLSAAPVAIIQIAIALLSQLFGGFFGAEAVSLICAVGYVILFFSGFNMLSGDKFKISTVNMLPSIIIVILISLIKRIF